MSEAYGHGKARPVDLRPIDRLEIAVGGVMSGTTMRPARNMGQSTATKGYFTVVARNQRSVEVYYYDTEPDRELRANTQQVFMIRMELLLFQRFGTERVTRKKSRGRKGFKITLN